MSHRILIAVLGALLALPGCSRLHTNTKGSDITAVPVSPIPLEVSVKVGEKISGQCKYTSLLGISFDAPEKRAFGVHFDQRLMNFGGLCTEGAVYEAVTKGNADVLISPRYFVSGTTFLCLPVFDACLWRNVDITVVGYKGTYEKFDKEPLDLRKARITHGKESDLEFLKKSFFTF